MLHKPWVLITFVDGWTMAERGLSVRAQDLLHAVVWEGGGPHLVSELAAQHIALATPGRRFIFTKPLARERMARRYSPDLLERLEAALRQMSDEEITTSSCAAFCP